jgi:hypothetical protein
MAAKAKTETVTVRTIKVLGDKSYRAGSARATYWEFIKQLDGTELKVLEEKLEAAKAEAWRAKLAGEEFALTVPKAQHTYDALEGWLRFFVKEGLVKYETKAAKAN